MNRKNFSIRSALSAVFALAVSLTSVHHLSAASGTEKGIPLTAGYLPTTGHAKYFVAYEEGFFAEEGLDVKLVEFLNSADGLAALRAHKLDVAAFGTSAPLLHISKGADLRIIGGVMGEDASVFTTKDKAHSIHSIADLKGKKIATVRLASGDAILRGALAEAGIDWQKDVQLFELKNPPAVQEAVLSGQVDAGVTWGPFDIRAEQAGLEVVIRSRNLYPGHPCCRLTVNNDDRYRKTPEVWVKFLRAFLKAEKFTQENREQTVEDIHKYFPIDKETIYQGYYEGFLDQSTDPNLTGLQNFWHIILSSGFAESDKDIAGYVDVDLYREALQSLITEQPDELFWQQKLIQYQSRN